MQLKEAFQAGCPYAETYPDTTSDNEYSGNGGLIDLSYEVSCYSRCLKVVGPECTTEPDEDQSSDLEIEEIF